MGILLCQHNFRDVWIRNKIVRQKLVTFCAHTHTHAAKLVVEMWKTQFKTLLNCVTTDTHKCATIDALSTICDDSYIDVTPDMVSVAISKLKCGKACGSDRLFAGHYIHADSRLAVLLSTFFTSALTHGHVPDAFMQSILVPVIKKTNQGTLMM